MHSLLLSASHFIELILGVLILSAALLSGNDGASSGVPSDHYTDKLLIATPNSTEPKQASTASNKTPHQVAGDRQGLAS